MEDHYDDGKLQKTVKFICLLMICEELPCVKKFEDTDREWLHFVVGCRNGKEIYKEYDAVIGNVANDDVFKCVSMYMDGIWDEERTLSELRYFRKNDQIAF